MRARFGLLICVTVIAASACARENPAFDEPTETQADADTTADTADELPPESEGSEVGEDCTIASGVDMVIKVPQPCGETDDVLGIYQHWFKVVEAAGSVWSVQFCDQYCLECEPVPGALELSPLPVATIAGPDTCMLMTGRRLGSGDDCNYHAITLVNGATNDSSVLVVARRTELIDLPSLDPGTGLAGFEPGLVVDQTCDCAVSPDSCCGDQAPTLWAYEVGGTQVAVGDTQTVTLGQRSYEFWAFDAYSSGDCDAPIELSWALTANQ